MTLTRVLATSEAVVIRRPRTRSRSVRARMSVRTRMPNSPFKEIYAYPSGGHTLKEIGAFFGLHYAQVSRIARRVRDVTYKTLRVAGAGKRRQASASRRCATSTRPSSALLREIPVGA
jgi:hypothetical protein